MMSVLYDEEVIKRNYIKEVTDEAEKRGEARGAKGIVDLSRKFGLSDEEIVSCLQQGLEISEEEVKKYLEMFGK